MDNVEKVACNCPECGGKAMVSREAAENNEPKRCRYCGITFIPRINPETNEIELINDEQLGIENNAVCNCPECGGKAVVSREAAENNDPKKCRYCGKTFIPRINPETNIIEVNRNEQLGFEKNAVCNCPTCAAERVVSREDAENNEAKKCRYCGKASILSINPETNKIEMTDGRNISNGKNAVCNCPTCAAERVITREKAQMNSPAKCRYCKEVYVPFINPDTNTIGVMSMDMYLDGIQRLKEAYYEAKENLMNNDGVKEASRTM